MRSNVQLLNVIESESLILFTKKYLWIGIMILILISNNIDCRAQGYSTAIIDKRYTIADGLLSNEVHFVYEDDENYIWFGTDEGLSRFDGLSFKNYSQEDGLPEAFVLNLKRLNSGKTIGWTLHGSIFYFENGEIENIPVSRNMCERYDKCIITDIVDDENGNLYVSHSDLNGYNKIDLDGNVEIIDAGSGGGLMYKTIKINSQWFSYFKYDSNVKSGQILISKSNTFFVNRIRQFRDSKPLEINGSFYQIIDDKLVVTTDEESFVVELPEPCWSLNLKGDNLLLFSHFYGYFRYSLKDNRFIDGEKKYPNYSITNLLLDSRGIEWITTHSDGVIRNTSNKVSQLKSALLEGKYIHKSRKLSDGTIFVLADENEYKKASLWKLNLDSTVTKIDRDVDTRILFQDLKEENNLIYFRRSEAPDLYRSKAYQDDSRSVNAFMNCINDFNSENINISLPQKMIFRDSCLVSIQRNILTVYCNDEQNNRRLEFDKKLDFRSIAASQEYIFIGTKNSGLFYVDRTTLEVSKFDKELSSNHIKAITAQSEDTLFIATAKGIHRLIFTSNSSRLKGFICNNIGLPVQEINDIDYFNDSLLITYDNAIYSIPSATFDELDRLNTKSFISDVEYSETIANSFSKIIKYVGNYIRFSFSDLYFDSPLKQTIWYRLRGHKKGWTESTTRNLEYVSLPPNKYILEIANRAAKNGDFVICDRYEFEIETPFYFSNWMYSFYGISTLLTIILLILLVRRYDRQKQERIFNLKSLRLKVLMSQLNPHFIFNVLNGIQSLIVENNTIQASDKLADFSRLLRNTLGASDRSLISIKDDLTIIKEYCNFEKIRKNGDVEILFGVDPQVESFYTPPMLIQPLIENSLRHGLKNVKGRKGIIEIEINLIGNYICFSVKDNGKGINKEGKVSYGKGIQLVKERANIINEKNNVDINFNVISNSSGTTISFNLAKISKEWT